jgi:hypothetical protein
MAKCCIVCRAVASPDIMLQYCAACQSALYCSRACQRIDWKQRQHKEICKLLNVGHGGMQMRTEGHTSRSKDMKELLEINGRNLEEGEKRFFILFEKSTLEGSRAAAKKMKKYAKQQTKHNQEFLLFHSLNTLIRFSNSEMLSWSNSPLLAMLQFVDPDVLLGEEGIRVTLLHQLADLLDPFDFSTHVNQLILAKQLVEYGANVNALSIPGGMTPLHRACCSRNVTNLDFVEYLLEKGADPNAQEHLGYTPLMVSIPDAPGAAKFLLNWPTTDANVTTRSGASFLAMVRLTITESLRDNLEKAQDQFQLQQWREIEVMLVERGAVGIDITTLE